MKTKLTKMLSALVCPATIILSFTTSAHGYIYAHTKEFSEAAGISSPIRSVKMNGNKASPIIYPNLLQNTLSLYLPNAATMHASLNICSSNDEMVYSDIVGNTRSISVPVSLIDVVYTLSG